MGKSRGCSEEALPQLTGRCGSSGSAHGCPAAADWRGYDWALAAQIEQYFEHEPAAGTPRADRFGVLAALIAEYKGRHWLIDPPDPGAAIRARMDQAGFTQADLAHLLGSRSRASEILAGRRGLRLEQIRRLHEEWHIPAEALIQPSRTAPSTLLQRRAIAN